MMIGSLPVKALSYSDLSIPAATNKKAEVELSTPLPTSSIKDVPLTINNPRGVLSSFNVEEVLKLNSEPPVDMRKLKGLTNRELFGEAIKRSKAAYTAQGTDAPKSLTDVYSQKDLDMVRAATGYNVVVLNNGTSIVDDNGNPPPEDVGRNIQNLLGDIESDRQVGRLSGQITPQYMTDEFAKYAEAAKHSSDTHSLPDEWLTKALEYLANSLTPSQAGVDKRV